MKTVSSASPTRNAPHPDRPAPAPQNDDGPPGANAGRAEGATKVLGEAEGYAATGAGASE
jgi:hypothetical protein